MSVEAGGQQMGRPAHYGREITTRCRSLLEHLMPVVAKGLPDDGKFEGPLTTTFLLAMATPMIVLPVERIYKPSAGIEGAADDQALHSGLKDEVAKVLDGKMKFGDAPFFGKADWRYVPALKPFNIAGEWPGDLLKGLSAEAAAKAAKEAPAKTIVTHIRNALAHGGVTYLDQWGGQSHGQAAMLGLVSARTKERKVVNVSALRVSEAGFLEFVRAWGDWIERSGVVKALSEDRDLAA